QGVREIRLLQLTVTHGVGEPSVVRLASKLEDPARHRDGDTVSSKFTDERVAHFPGRCAWAKYAAARRSTSFSCSSNRTRLRASRSSVDSLFVTPGLAPSSTSAWCSQLRKQDSLMPKSFATCLIGVSP